MARTANRRINAEKKALESTEGRMFQTAIYARISRDKKEKPSDSIENQITLCENYIRNQQGLNIVGIYKDISATGTNFEREEFEQMMTEVRRGKVNCIVVKDLSRFGRNYTELGNYLEKIFPFLNIRFIAVSEKLDTFHMEDPNKSLEVVLKNIVNETYAKDISKKVSSAHQARIKQGNFICGYAPYGYKVSKDEKGIRRLFIDEKSAPIVKGMFESYLKGLSTLDIAKELSNKRIRIATEYRKQGSIIASDEERIKVWQPATVLQILKNRTYTGILIQGKRQKRLYEGKELHLADEQEWTITENAHQAIVSEETFEQVQNLLQENVALPKQDVRKQVKKKEDCIFKGKVYCSLCKRKLSLHQRMNGNICNDFFTCNRFGSYQTDKCGVSITGKTLEKTVQEAFLMLISQNKKNYKAHLEGYKKAKKELETAKDRKLTTIERELSAISRLQSDSYEKYVLGHGSKENFEKEKEELFNQKTDLEKQKERTLSHHEEQMQKLNENHRYLSVVLKGKDKKWDKEFVDALIDRIYVGKDHTIEIQFRFEETMIETERVGRKQKVKEV